MKDFKDFGSMLKEIYPCEFTPVVNETHIITFPIDRITTSPRSSEKFFSKGTLGTLFELGTFTLLASITNTLFIQLATRKRNAILAKNMTNYDG